MAKSSNRGAIGAICRSDHGIFLGASAVIFDGIMNPATLEALACGKDLVWGEDLLESDVQLVTDCLRVVRDLCMPNQLRDNCMILKEIVAR